MFYSVVLLDGQEIHCLSLEEVQELFFKRQLNQDSLICNAEDGKWQMLRRTFDVSQWISNGASPAAQNPFQTPNNPFQQPAQTVQTNSFEQSDPADQPVTFNQFPPSQPNNPYASNGYSQNNQTETYYQAETNQTNYNFQNNPSTFTPSKYSNTGNSYNYAPVSSNGDGSRPGIKPAAVFLIINACFVIAYLIFGNAVSGSISEGGGTAAFQTGRKTGAFLPLVIDLLLAVKLLKLDNPDSARKWVLARAYFGFIVAGLIAPLVCFGLGQIFIGAYLGVSTFFFFISLALELHGKENPSQGRVMLGLGTFAIYFLVMFGTIALAVVGSMAPQIAKLNIQNTQFEKYKIEGKEYEDKTTGAKVVLPEGWSMINLNNPVIHSPEARMIAVDKAGNNLTMLEVVPVPGNLDMKRQNSTFILDQLSDNVVEALKEEVQNSSGFGSRNSASEVTRMSIFIGTHPAKLLVIDKSVDGEKSKGHLIITYDELTFYVLHSWCPREDYEKSQNDFTFFEKNFTVPEKINSTFTQTAENDKKR